MSELVIKNMPFRVGQTLTVKGVPHHYAYMFSVNIRHGEDDFALHVSPRFDHRNRSKIVVINSKRNGSWGAESVGKTFPFHYGKEFTISIAFHPKEFVVTLPDDSMMRYPNHIGAHQYSFLHFTGNASFDSIGIGETN
ncbi:beta-galactoside-binding lectin-like [Neosynchiropus ocellatus]